MRPESYAVLSTETLCSKRKKRFHNENENMNAKQIEKVTIFLFIFFVKKIVFLFILSCMSRAVSMQTIHKYSNM